MVGKLSTWYGKLNIYAKAQVVTVETVEEFLVKWDDDLEIARKEFYQMKCYSLKKKDLDKHFQNISRKFYQLRGTNNPNLKQTFLASTPEILSIKMFFILQQMN